MFAALGLEILWNPVDRQVTVWAEITEATLQAIPTSSTQSKTATPTPTLAMALTSLHPCGVQQTPRDGSTKSHIDL